jgi:hypothetical protein
MPYSPAAGIVIDQRARYERLWGALTKRQAALAASAMADIEADLKKARRGSWSSAMAAATLAQLGEATRGLSESQLRLLSRALPGIAGIAKDDLADYLGKLDEHYLGVARPLRWDALEWLEGYSRPLLRSRLRIYEKSYARYGAEAVAGIENAMAKSVLLGTPWTEARESVMGLVREQVGGRQWMVDRIIRNEVATIYSSTTMAALLEEDEPDDPMLKKLVALWDKVTGLDSKLLHGQTRRVQDLFTDAVHGKEFDAPPNRPNDREIVIGWRASWGDDAGFDAETRNADGSAADVHGDNLDVGAAIDEATKGLPEEKSPAFFRPIGAVYDELPKNGSEAWKTTMPSLQREWSESRAEFSRSLNRLADYHDEQAGGPGVPFKTPAEALRAMSERGIDISGLPNDAQWARVVEAELRKAQRNPNMCYLHKITANDIADDSGASLTAERGETLSKFAGSPLRATMNIQAHKFDKYGTVFDRDIADVAAGETPWLASARLSAGQRAAIVDTYDGILPKEQIVQLVHCLRHEIAHGYDFNINQQTSMLVDDQRLTALHRAWRDARKRVDVQTWYWNGAPHELDKWGDVVRPLVTTQPIVTSAAKFDDTWMAVSRYAETDDYERFAEAMAMAMSDNWDHIPPTLRPSLRAILESKLP